MEQEKVNTENGNSVKELVDEVNNLIKQVDCGDGSHDPFLIMGLCDYF